MATGYYVVRAITGEDVRTHATGSSGARNVARRAGIAAAAATFGADLGKGAAAVALAGAVAGGGAAAGALVAVVLGHVAPVQLGFRGGRGLGPGVGGLLVLDWRVAAVALLVAAVRDRGHAGIHRGGPCRRDRGARRRRRARRVAHRPRGRRWRPRSSSPPTPGGRRRPAVRT